jgi:hypothetical protein
MNSDVISEGTNIVLLGEAFDGFGFEVVRDARDEPARAGEQPHFRQT